MHRLTLRILTRISKARAIRHAWKHLIAAESAHSNSQNNAGRTTGGVRDDPIHEVELHEALEALISLSHEENEFLELVSAMLDTLSCSNPMASAFLTHVIDMAAIPSRDTAMKITDSIMNKLKGNFIKGKPPTRIRQNAAIVWGVLAERFPGPLSMALFKDSVCELLLNNVKEDPDMDVRLFSLIALEKFALTGQNKLKILAHNLQVHSLLQNVVDEMNNLLQIYKYQTSPSQTSTEPLPTQSSSTPAGLSRSKMMKRVASTASLSKVMRKKDKQAEKSNEKEREDRAEWARRMQLKFCAEWARKNSLGTDDNEKLSASIATPESQVNVMMNITDATTHWKMNESGLELRNDHSNFESIRATACVKSGVWYYEATLLTAGIMQIGWASKKCRFGPEDGTGVGDDEYGFGFDGCRSVIWSNGVHYSPPTSTSNSSMTAPCVPGDVLGILLDLENNCCIFYINGKDVGMKINLEPYQQQRLCYSSVEQGGGGLYPAMSLTSFQHVVVEFGDREPGFRYPPTNVGEWNPICKAGKVDENLRQQILLSTRRSSTGRPRLFSQSSSKASFGKMTLDSISTVEPVEDEDFEEEYKNMCSICYNHPSDIVLKPCGHDGFCMTCADIMNICPLCRIPIRKRTPTSLALPPLPHTPPSQSHSSPTTSPLHHIPPRPITTTPRSLSPVNIVFPLAPPTPFYASGSSSMATSRSSSPTSSMAPWIASSYGSHVSQSFGSGPDEGMMEPRAVEVEVEFESMEGDYKKNH